MSIFHDSLRLRQQFLKSLPQRDGESVPELAEVQPESSMRRLTTQITTVLMEHGSVSQYGDLDLDGTACDVVEAMDMDDIPFKGDEVTGYVIYFPDKKDYSIYGGSGTTGKDIRKARVYANAKAAGREAVGFGQRPEIHEVHMTVGSVVQTFTSTHQPSRPLWEPEIK